MRNNNTSRKKKFLALLLSALMASSTVVALASCEEDTSSSSSSSSSTEEVATDTSGYPVTNAGFQTFTSNGGLNLIGTSVNGWTRSVNSATSGTALSSKAASGIVDITDKNWKDLTTSALTGKKASELTEEEAASLWDTMTAKDKLDYYAAWKDNDANDDRNLSDLDFYQAFNIDNEDLPLVKDGDNLVPLANPLTHDYQAGADLTAKDANNKVLMIHNEYSNSTYTDLGTAQKFTSSSSVTVRAGTSAKFSVWVKTSNLTCTSTDGSSQPVVDKGAYVSVTHTVGGKTLDPLVVKNINTEGVTANNGWLQYEFILKGSSFADSTFTIVLGLGQGGGTDRYEYVNGYAFFDDIQCEIIDNADYDATGLEEITLTSEEKTFYADNTKNEKFALNFFGAFDKGDMLDGAWEIAPVTQKNTYGVQYTAVQADQIATFFPGQDVQTYPGLGLDASKDVHAILDSVSALNDTNNPYKKAVYDDYFKDTDFLTSEKALVLLSAWGVPYEAKSPVITIPAKDEVNDVSGKVAYSFFVKTSDMNGFTGAGVTVKDITDNSSLTSISSIDTTTATAITVNDKELYDGWQQVFIFLSNESENEQKVQISLQFGPTTVVDTTKTSYHAGFAAFAGFEKKTLSDEEYACAASGTYSKLVTLDGEYKDGEGDNGFDSAVKSSKSDIEKGFALLKNYKGVFSDSAYVGGATSNTQINAYAKAGLLNKEHEANYSEILTKLNVANPTWAGAFGASSMATQPLVIYNDAENDDKAYGFIGNSVSISSETYKAVSLSVKVSAGAVANVYLIDTEDDSYSNALSIGRRLTYWYDDDGNVCAKDPTEKGFDKTTDIAFKLQSNGLYKVNASWAGAKDLNKDAYYANLSAYGKNAEGDLVVAENGVTYDYSENWQHEGNDGIAFYNKDGKYYADIAKTVEVLDLASVETLTPRYTAKDGYAAQFTVTDTGNEWATVTFYIHTGSEAKNYRLEVWSGARDNSVVNPDGSFVAFDVRTPNDPDATVFANLIKARQNDLVDEEEYTSTSLSFFNGVFSFLDSDAFLRYDQSKDENEVGNSYESYLSSAYSKTVSALRYTEGNVYEMYADYATLDTTVAADVEEDDTTEDTEEETPAGETNIWLLAGSIVIAGALILAVVSLIIRKVFMKKRRTAPAKTIVRTSAPKMEKKVKKAPVKNDLDETDTYND
ncbi:MAG: hypothetical protein IJB34_03480 [Clostridia bacterium]|nr:hypothetical protein [Clostridia bacterium]